MNPWIAVVLTAGLSSLCTVGLVVAWMRRTVEPRWREETARQLDQAEARVRAGVRAGALEALAESGLEEAIRGIGDDVRAGVLRGVEEADLDGRLDALEQEIARRVKKGVVDGFASLATPHALRDTTLSMTESSANLVTGSLTGLLNGLAKSLIPDERQPPDD